MENIRTEFKKLVIETIHNLPYKEAIKKEYGNSNCISYYDNKYKCVFRTNKHISLIIDEHRADNIIIEEGITIGRVMKAFYNKYTHKEEDITIWNEHSPQKVIEIIDAWKITKKNGQEATDNDQTDETIKKLTTLLK